MMALLQVSYKRYVLLFCYLISMLITGCGIESFIYLEKPQRLAHDPSNIEDLSKRYCEFKTADSANTAGYFQGTEIYYRIYERKNDCQNESKQINQYNDNNPFAAAQYLETTKKYYRLATNQTSTRPLIGTHSSDVTVRFRLQDYGAPVSDPARLTVNGGSQGTPQRNNSLPNNKRSFASQYIAVNDDDVERSSVSSEINPYWCINFYAVSYGYTPTFSTLYSQLEYLGYILIEKNP